MAGCCFALIERKQPKKPSLCGEGFLSCMGVGFAEGTGAIVDAPALHNVGNTVIFEFAKLAEESGERVYMKQVFVADPVCLTAHDIDEAVLMLALYFYALAFVVVLHDESVVGHLTSLIYKNYKN